MIEQIGTLGQETISTPNPNSTAVVQALIAAGIVAPLVAEIGVGIGATTLAIAAILNNRGELHLYDFQAKVEELLSDLSETGFTNVRGFGNTDKHWDSYNWTLGRMILDRASCHQAKQPIDPTRILKKRRLRYWVQSISLRYLIFLRLPVLGLPSTGEIRTSLYFRIVASNWLRFCGFLTQSRDKSTT